MHAALVNLGESRIGIRVSFKAVALCMLVLGTSACSWTHERADADNTQRKRDEAFAKFDVAHCTATGGKVQGVCMSGMPACVRQYGDAGKECTDKSDCQGLCVQKEPWASAGTQVAGVCEVSNEPCGCRSIVVAGKAKQGLCED
jgi:hypothetical protein